MKIKKLEIKGFKSFPDKTDFEFIPGITSVVGPNGCGKSNVLEAIRWTMGEQRARTLRGKKMEDVIFNGSETRKPVGMAEVRLVLSNTEGLSPSHMADYDEIMITRRLFRDGESNYEINNVPCRLSDVTDFFLDTGVGRNSYAIIEQGRVDMVVAAKPEERRIFIEEAAGIVRYKSRKEAAIKKLEQTNQNLVRIHDLVTEVKRQSKSLKKQASRAERYVTLNDRLRELDIGLHAYRCSEIQENYSRVGHELDARQTALSEKEAVYAESQANLEASRVQALDAERQLQELLEARHGIDLDLASVRNRMSTDRGSLSRVNDRQTRLAAETEALRVAMEEGGNHLQALEKNRAHVRTDFQATAAALDSDLASVREAEQQLADRRKLLDHLKEELFRTLQDTAQQRNRRDTLTKRRNDLASQRDRISGDSEAIRRRVSSDQVERDRLGQAIQQTDTALQESVRKKEELARDRATTVQHVAELRSGVGALEKRLAAARARLESLEEMQRDYSGYDRSVRYLMKEREAQGNRALLGPVAEIIEVPPEFQKALTASLGERLGHLLVSSPREGADAARALAEAGVGRTTFIPLAPRCSEDPQASDAPEGLTRLQDVVRFRPGFEHLGAYLLDRCFVVEDMSTAVDIWEANGIQVDLVTAAGEVVNRYGEITGGSQEKGCEEIFEKRREIGELTSLVAALEKDLQATATSLQEQEALQERLAQDCQEIDRLMNDLKVKDVRMRKDKERVDGALSGARRRLDILDLEAQRHEKEIEGISNGLATCNEALEALEERRRQQEQEKDQTRIGVEELTHAMQDKSRQTAEIRVRVAQLEERNRSLDREYESCRDRMKQQERHLAELTTEAQRIEAELSELEQDIASGGAREKELMRTHGDQTTRIEKLKARSGELAAVIRGLEEESSSARNLITEVRDAIHGLQVESARLEQVLQDLVEKILERHHVDPRTTPVPETLPDETELADLRNKLADMGEVNLAARVESRQIEERLTFLLEQEADLKKAVDSLYTTIGKINRTSRERFREAFERVDAQFREIFPFLFRGGEARLELTDEEDLLETGVEIMVRPPGKRIQNMDLLSGGEKALTAVALIFAIFLTKPSPFCLLDEVDAPLDDANLSRFNEMLRKLSDRTQFLVVTHNKRSMQAADALYGITMEEPGVSRAVSVAFVD
jgi:chromosome segregation protein